MSDLAEERHYRLVDPTRRDETRPAPWHKDADLGRTIEVVTRMGKSRKLDFLDYQATDESFFDLFARMCPGRPIP
jgi:hypothetical protein